jgi:hypothetical protein
MSGLHPQSGNPISNEIPESVSRLLGRMRDAVNPLPVREQGNDEDEDHKDKDRREHVLCRGTALSEKKSERLPEPRSTALDSPWRST